MSTYVQAFTLPYLLCYLEISDEMSEGGLYFHTSSATLLSIAQEKHEIEARRKQERQLLELEAEGYSEFICNRYANLSSFSLQASSYLRRYRQYLEEVV